MKTILFEGYYDVNSGYEFDMPVLFISPKRRLFDVGNVGEIETIIEDYFIDMDITSNRKVHIWKNDKHISADVVKNDIARAKRGNRRFKYWYALVKYDPSNPIDYSIIEKKGF